MWLCGSLSALKPAVQRGYTCVSFNDDQMDGSQHVRWTSCDSVVDDLKDN